MAAIELNVTSIGRINSISDTSLNNTYAVVYNSSTGTPMGFEMDIIVDMDASLVAARADIAANELGLSNEATARGNADTLLDEKIKNTSTGHDHDGVDSRVVDHDNLANKGTNTHTQIDAHIANTVNPHSVTKTQVGLGSVDNTSDVNKPVSTAQQAALDLKVDKVTGKGLSANDYTTEEKAEVAKIATIESDIFNIQSTLNSNIFGGYTEGYFLNETGSLLIREQYVVVDPILVEYGETYYKYGDELVLGYDKDDTLIKLWDNPVTSITIDDPEIQYVRYSEFLADVQNGLAFFSKEPFKSTGILQSKVNKKFGNKLNILYSDLEIQSDYTYIYTETEEGVISQIETVSGVATIPAGNYVRIIEANFIVDDLLTSLLYLKSAKTYAYSNKDLSDFSIGGLTNITKDGNVATIPGDRRKEDGLYLSAAKTSPFQHDGYIMVTIDFITSHEKGISFADPRNSLAFLRGVTSSGTYLLPISTLPFSNAGLGFSTYLGQQGTITLNSFKLETPYFTEIEFGMNSYYRNGVFIGHCESSSGVSARNLRRRESVTIDLKMDITKDNYSILSIRDERGAELIIIAIDDITQPSSFNLFSSKQVVNGSFAISEATYMGHYGNAVMSIRNMANEIRKLSIEPSSVVLLDSSDEIIHTFSFTAETLIDDVIDAINASNYDLEAIRYSSAGVRLDEVQECKFILSQSIPVVDEWGNDTEGNVIDSWPCFVYLKNAYNLPLRVIIEKTPTQVKMGFSFNKKDFSLSTLNYSYQDIQIVADESVKDLKIRDGVYMPRKAFGLMMHHMVDAKEYDGVAIPPEINTSEYSFTCTSGRFKRVLEYLKIKGWKPISVRDYVKSVYDNDNWGDNEKVFMVTYDDADLDHYKLLNIQRYMIRNKIPAFMGLWKYSTEFVQGAPIDWDTVIEIRDRLSEDGWCFGYHNYLHGHIEFLSFNQFKEQYDNMEAMMISDDQLETTHTGDYWDSTGVTKYGHLLSYGWIWAYGSTSYRIQEYANQNGCPIGFQTTIGTGAVSDRNKIMTLPRLGIDDVHKTFEDIKDIIDSL